MTMGSKYTEEQEEQAKKIALQIAEELAGGLQNIIVCTGCKDFLALQHVGSSETRD